jgi:hypothetical protein
VAVAVEIYIITIDVAINNTNISKETRDPQLVKEAIEDGIDKLENEDGGDKSDEKKHKLLPGPLDEGVKDVEAVGGGNDGPEQGKEGQGEIKRGLSGQVIEYSVNHSSSSDERSMPLLCGMRSKCKA